MILLQYRLILVVNLFVCLGVHSLSSQSLAPINWQHQDFDKTSLNGTNLIELYDYIASTNRRPSSVIVGILDSGVETDHEDLDNSMWINPGEIANNGKDDDKNGYIDDLHGWNFLGGPDGQNVNADTYEQTRLVAQMNKYFEGKNIDELKAADAKKYKEYLVMKESVDKNMMSAKNNYEALSSQAAMIDEMVADVKDVMGGRNLTEKNIDLLQDTTEQITRVKSFLTQVLPQVGENTRSVQDLEDALKQDLQGGLDYYGGGYKYHHNVDFDPRSIIGDNYADKYEKIYGNNDFEGPDALHGTHVAGIVGAEIDNGVGGNGMSKYAKIMTVRVVPDGDERDKDVANGIIYAVDNGAKVINMSFGKGYSPEKEVVDKAVKYALKNDVLLVHAAGNAAQNNDVESNFPNARFDKIGLFGPKEAKNWIEVGALAPDQGENMVATFSNYGANSVDIFAPGVAIFAAVPDNSYKKLSGTSMASPVVAGAAALIRSYFPELSAKQVKKCLVEGGRTVSQSVIKPGSEDEKVAFSSLSRSGKILDVYGAYKMAEKMSKN